MLLSGATLHPTSKETKRVLIELRMLVPNGNEHVEHSFSLLVLQFLSSFHSFSQYLMIFVMSHSFIYHFKALQVWKEMKSLLSQFTFLDCLRLSEKLREKTPIQPWNWGSGFYGSRAWPGCWDLYRSWWFSSRQGWVCVHVWCTVYWYSYYIYGIFWPHVWTLRFLQERWLTWKWNELERPSIGLCPRLWFLCAPCISFREAGTRTLNVLILSQFFLDSISL